MKPFSIFLSIVLVIVSLSVVVWIGRYGAAIPTATSESSKEEPAASVEDLPVPKSGPYGKVEIDETLFNFGFRVVDSKDEHLFKLKNVGEGKLQYRFGKPSCQCTGVEVTKDNGEVVEYSEGGKAPEGVMAPGESINILIKWKMMSRMEMFRHGVKVFTTDPDRRMVDIAVTGKVNMAFTFRPDGVWDLGELSQTEPTKADGSLTSSMFEEFKVTEEPRENSRVKLSFTPLDPALLPRLDAKGGYQVTAEVGADLPAGPFKEIIKLKVESDEKQQDIDLVIVAHRGGPIEIRGVRGGATFNSLNSRLNFADFPADKGRKAEMTLFVKGFDDELLLQGVEPADTRFIVKLTKGNVLGKTRSYQLEVEIPPGPAARHRGDQAEIISLKFNHPAAPEFKMVLDYNAVR